MSWLDVVSAAAAFAILFVLFFVAMVAVAMTGWALFH